MKLRGVLIVAALASMSFTATGLHADTITIHLLIQDTTNNTTLFDMSSSAATGSLSLSFGTTSSPIQATLTGNSNTPGQPVIGGLLTQNTLNIKSSTSDTIKFTAEVYANSYTIPGSPVLVTTNFANSQITGATADESSRFNSSAIGVADGTLIGSHTGVTAPVGMPNTFNNSILGSYSGSYALESLAVVTTNGPDSVANMAFTTTATPGPEPWSIVSFMSMLVPVGLVSAVRRRKLLA